MMSLFISEISIIHYEDSIYWTRKNKAATIQM